MKDGPVMRILSNVKSLSMLLVLLGVILTISGFMVKCDQKKKEVNEWHWAPVVVGIFVIFLGGIGFSHSTAAEAADGS